MGLGLLTFISPSVQQTWLWKYSIRDDQLSGQFVEAVHPGERTDTYVLRVMLSRYVCSVAFSSVVLLMSPVTSSMRESNAVDSVRRARQHLQS